SRKINLCRDQTAVVIHCSSFCLGAAPTWRDASSPFLNSISVGMDMIPYFAAVFGFSSTFSLTILTLPPMAPAISSSAGAIIRHGPHHSAQKSTTTGSPDLSTSVSKVASETLPTDMDNLVCCRRGVRRCGKVARKYGRLPQASRRLHWCPASEVRDTSQHPLDTNFGSKGAPASL